MTPRRCAPGGSPSTRTPWRTRTSRPSAVTSTRSSARPRPGSRLPARCAPCAPNARPCRRRNTATSRFSTPWLRSAIRSIRSVGKSRTSGPRTLPAGLKSLVMTEFAAPLPILARYAVMVDVGYIYAAAGELLFGSSSRRDFRVDAVPLIQVVTKHGAEIIRGELLRVYWYDAARDRVPTIDPRVIAQMPSVKLRLGNLNARGQQKGVDAQIRADMEALARHRRLHHAGVLSGDEDMVPAVEAAQAFGVRVHLWGVEPPYGTNQAERLVWESDTVEVLERSFIEPFFAPQPTTEAGPSVAQGTLPARVEQVT